MANEDANMPRLVRPLASAHWTGNAVDDSGSMLPSHVGTRTGFQSQLMRRHFGGRAFLFYVQRNTPLKTTTTVLRMSGNWAAVAAPLQMVPAVGSPAAAASARVALNPAPRPAPGTAPPAPGPAPAPTQRTAPAAGCLRTLPVAVQPAQPETVAAACTTADCRLAGDRTAAVGRSRRAAARMPAAAGTPPRPAAAASRLRQSGRTTPPLHARPSAPTAPPLHMHKSPAVSL